MKTRFTQYGKKEIMLVAHAVVKRHKQSIGDSLRDAWQWFKSGSRSFTGYLRMTIKNKRLTALKGMNVRNTILGQPEETGPLAAHLGGYGVNYIIFYLYNN